MAAGLDLVSGMHDRLADNRELAAAARDFGRNLIDVRTPPAGLPAGTGRKRSGRRVLTVGTDCGVGKKYTALALTHYFLKRGLKAEFRATGQTGIMIAGSGIPIDAVIADSRLVRLKRSVRTQPRITGILSRDRVRFCTPRTQASRSVYCMEHNLTFLCCVTIPAGNTWLVCLGFPRRALRIFSISPSRWDA